MTCNLYR